MSKMCTFSLKLDIKMKQYVNIVNFLEKNWHF